MMIRYSKYFILLLLLTFSFNISFVNAQLINSDGKDAIVDSMEEAGDAGTYNTGGSANNPLIADAVGTVVAAFLSLMGIIFLIMVLIGGFNWMTAGGNEDKVTKSRQTIIRGIVGLIIVVASYAISAFVFKALGGIIGA